MNKISKRILLIGNKTPHLQLLADTCQQADICATVALSPTIAHKELSSCHYDLLVLDLDLKRKPNIDLICEVDEKSPYMPLVLLTNDYRQSQQLIFGLFELDIKGSWHILEKPFFPQTFSSHVRDILNEEEKILLAQSNNAGEAFFERRRFLRRQQFQPIRFAYEHVTYGSRFKTVTRGFLTDASIGGLGMLTNRCLEEQQYLSFENGLFCGTGQVAWRSSIDEMTYKVGICFG